MEFTVKSEKRDEVIDITERVKELLKGSLERGKACLIFVQHTTCSVLINESCDKGVCEDILASLRSMFPRGVWQHDAGGGDNGDSHLKANILGNSVMIPIENGELQLGTWQKIAFVEFDGPRDRKVIVKII